MLGSQPVSVETGKVGLGLDDATDCPDSTPGDASGTANAPPDAPATTPPDEVFDLTRRLATLTPDQRAALASLLAPPPVAAGRG